MSAARVVVVGAGIAGASCARTLAAAGIEVSVLDRGRAPGGRMASPTIADRRVDIGAAYFTARDDDFAAVVADWHSRGLARDWTDTLDVLSPMGRGEPRTGPIRHAAPGGLRSLVRDLLEGLDVTLDRPVAVVDVRGGHPAVDGAASDAVVLAMPDPQAVRIAPSVAAVQVGANGSCEPVIAVAAGWDRRSWDLDAAAFVNDDPDLALVADDGSRRGDGAAVLVAHSTAELARRHADDPDGAIAPVLAALGAGLGVTRAPQWTRAHRWTFAKPTDTHGAASHLLTDDLIGVAGDAWCPAGAPRVESAWLSGRDLGRALLDRLR